MTLVAFFTGEYSRMQLGRRFEPRWRFLSRAKNTQDLTQILGWVSSYSARLSCSARRQVAE
jgi:hypothetical protein